MSKVQQELLVIKGMLFDMSESDQSIVKDMMDRINNIISESGVLGIVAMAILGLEYAKKAEQ